MARTLLSLSLSLAHARPSLIQSGAHVPPLGTLRRCSAGVQLTPAPSPPVHVSQTEALVSVLSGLAKQRPLILCVEDAENLDADSLSVLDALVAQLDALRLRLPGLGSTLWFAGVGCTFGSAPRFGSEKYGTHHNSL